MGTPVSKARVHRTAATMISTRRPPLRKLFRSRRNTHPYMRLEICVLVRSNHGDAAMSLTYLHAYSRLVVLLATRELHCIPNISNYQHGCATFRGDSAACIVVFQSAPVICDASRRKDVRGHWNIGFHRQRRCCNGSSPHIEVHIHFSPPFLQRYHAPPSIAVQVLTYVAFPLAAAISRPLFGTTLLYDLVAVYAGQRGVVGAEDWSTRVGWTALAVGAIVGFKGMMAGWACT